MVLNTGFVATALALANIASALPSTSTSQMSLYKQANLTWTTDQRMMAAFECRGQSCLIADTAGSTGRNPSMRAEGAGDAEVQCIAKYNPVISQLLSAYGNKVPDVPSQGNTWMSSFLAGANNFLKPILPNARETGSFTGTCAANILIFAKGTFEPAAFGLTVGPALTRGLPYGWSTQALDYDPDLAGDYCLGLPGGMVARDTINGANEKCPNAQIFLSGYSQGAMAVRNGLARASDRAKQQVKGVITFGDPFDGAPIKGYNGPMEVFCATDDGVCTGNFELRLAHFSYPLDDSVTRAKAKLLEMAAGRGVNNCCNPSPLPSLPSPQEWAASIAANGGKLPKAKVGTTVEQWAQAVSQSHGKIPQYADTS